MQFQIIKRNNNLVLSLSLKKEFILCSEGVGSIGSVMRLPSLSSTSVAFADFGIDKLASPTKIEETFKTVEKKDFDREVKKQIPAARKYFYDLHYSMSQTDELSKYLAKLKTAKEQKPRVFIEGVQLFTKIANFNKEQRLEFFGNKFAGLHYANDLTDWWNASSGERIEAHQLIGLCPCKWDFEIRQNLQSFIYRGDKPSIALDKFLQGPTVIDCGMFCQLSIWFGIRYMLGDEKFNQLFGNTPFYITQLFYVPIEDPSMPYSGNPLYPFFTRNFDAQKQEPTIEIMHVPNHPQYQIKHPGGASGGNNCIVIDNGYTIFKPGLEKTAALSIDEVELRMVDAFNSPQNDKDQQQLALYAETPECLHPHFGMSLQQLIDAAKTNAKLTIDKQDLDALAKKDKCRLRFDFESFNNWIKSMEKTASAAPITYAPLTAEKLQIDEALSQQIPFENKNINFSTFSKTTAIQQDLYKTAIRFCDAVMQKQSCCMILTGKAGIGKTAAAVSSAKELTSKGKKVVWISEVMVSGWMDKAKDVKDLENCRDAIKKLLANNPDAVFLDDDNLVGLAGKSLLEEIYAWYVSNPGKGLFITSNSNITFEDCYGIKLDGIYHFPPFPGYDSAAYQNMIIRRDLSGQSMRQNLDLKIAELSDSEKMMRLLSVAKVGQTIGIIVSPECYKSAEHRLSKVEYIPAIDDNLICEIRRSLQDTKTKGAAYEKLSSLEKSWLEQFTVSEEYCDDGKKIPAYPGIKVRNFEFTSCSTIAIEIMQYNSINYSCEIDSDSMSQLLAVINYSHDQGGKKVIIINRTEFSHQELLTKFEAKINEKERARTMSRLNNLLFASSLTISDCANVRRANGVSMAQAGFFSNLSTNSLSSASSNTSRSTSTQTDSLSKNQ
jgi:DNA replication protein DnaC